MFPRDYSFERKNHLDSENNRILVKIEHSYQKFLRNNSNERLNERRIATKELLDRFHKEKTKRILNTDETEKSFQLIRSQSKKSCLHIKDYSSYNSVSPNSLKKVRFNDDTEVSLEKKITANSILSLIRQENKHLPDILNKKKLYYQLDNRFGLEDCNDYYRNYFLTPVDKLIGKKHYGKFALRRLYSKNNQVIEIIK